MKRNASFIWLFLFILLVACREKQTQEIPVSVVKQGTIYLDIYETGEVQAIQSTNILTPDVSWRYGSLKIAQLVDDGSEVKAGDTLVVFDPTDVRKAIIDAESRLEISLAELKRLKAQHQSDLEGLKADYQVAEIAQEIARIQFESAVYEAAIKRQEIQLNLEKANIALARAKEEINNTVKIQNEEIKQKNLSIEQDRSRLREANETLDKY